MADELLDELESLERQGWDALCDGTASDFYGRTMTSDGAMVLADGQAMTRSEVVSSLRNAPSWDDYQMSGVRLVTTGRDSAGLVYRATARRDGEEPFVALTASVYVVVTGSWRLALYTQTPVP
jgi:hypothetical protein